MSYAGKVQLLMRRGCVECGSYLLGVAWQLRLAGHLGVLLVESGMILGEEDEFLASVERVIIVVKGDPWVAAVVAMFRSPHSAWSDNFAAVYAPFVVWFVFGLLIVLSLFLLLFFSVCFAFVVVLRCGESES